MTSYKFAVFTLLLDLNEFALMGVILTFLNTTPGVLDLNEFALMGVILIFPVCLLHCSIVCFCKQFILVFVYYAIGLLMITIDGKHNGMIKRY